MLRKTLKAAAWVAASLIGVVVTIYVAAVVVNWRDEPPSPDAVELTASYESRPSVADSDNAFIYLLGFDAPLTDDPREVGLLRLAWLRSGVATPSDRAADPQTTHVEYASTDPVVEEFLRVCGTDSRECASAFDAGRAVFDAWTATHPWALERYLALIDHSGWREEILGVSAPLPAYAPALRAQRLLLLQAKTLADDGDARAAGELLARDARFWRGVLASSDLLITKMLAIAALRQHFAWGNLALRNVRGNSIASGVPDVWRQPMTDTELSLRRALVGEWMHFASWVPTLEYATTSSDATFAARTGDRLLRPLFQPQATLNAHAAYLDALADTVDAPIADYARAADLASALARQTADDAVPPHSLHNVLGALALGASPFDYAAYVRRVGDLEGMRRGALAAVLLRGAGTATSAVPEALAASPLRNPYDGTPLRWHAEERAVIFVGLEPGERGEHRYHF